MIFTSIEEIKRYTPPNVNNDFNTISPYLQRALTFIYPYLSRDLYTELDDDYAAGNDDPQTNYLLQHAQRALACFAYYIYVDEGTVMLDDSGIRRIEDDTYKSAHQWQTIRFKESMYNAGYAALEELLYYLQQNKNTYSAWTASNEYVELKTYFHYLSSTFAKYRRISGAGLLYELRPSMLHIQEELIQANIGADLYTELLQENETGTFSADNAALMPYIYKAVAHLSVERALQEQILTLDKAGLSISSLKTDREIMAVDADRLAAYAKDAMEKGNAALKELKQYLNTNASATKYASYFSSSLYTNPAESANGVVFRNTSENTTFFAV